jgi:2-phosphosulfolactate phosphatase
MTFDQAEFQVRCEWGLEGLRALAPAADVVVIVDVLSFTTAVEIATSRGAFIFPYRFKDAAATAYARSVDAELASSDRGSGYSLSPASLRKLNPGSRLVLPSPNGSELSFAADNAAVFAACLRNAAATACAAARAGKCIAVIPAGERWPTGALRPSFEDMLGAGAVIDALPGTRSPEAEQAASAFHRFRHQLAPALRACSSGKELIERGFAPDVEIAAELNVSTTVARLRDRCYGGVSA